MNKSSNLLITSSIKSDIVNNIHTVFKDYDYVCYTDDPSKVKSKEYRIEQYYPFSSIEFLKFKNRRDAKIYKILPHIFEPGYKSYTWCDPTHHIYKDLTPLLENYNAIFIHHKTRKSVYSEIDELRKYSGYETPYTLNAQYNYYKDTGFKVNELFECPVFITDNSRISLQFRLSWWEHVCQYSSRDQISAPFCANLTHNGERLKYKIIWENIQDVLPVKHNKIAQKFKNHDNLV